jgi:hypothetical protein
MDWIQQDRMCVIYLTSILLRTASYTSDWLHQPTLTCLRLSESCSVSEDLPWEVTQCDYCGRGTLRNQAIKGTEFCQFVEENTNKINARIVTLLVTCFQEGRSHMCFSFYIPHQNVHIGPSRRFKEVAPCLKGVFICWYNCHN